MRQKLRGHSITSGKWLKCTDNSVQRSRIISTEIYYSKFLNMYVTLSNAVINMVTNLALSELPLFIIFRVNILLKCIKANCIKCQTCYIHNKITHLVRREFLHYS